MSTFKLNSQKCLAFTRSRTPCPENRAENSKWCPTHEELQGKCMRIYKHHSRQLDRYAVENPYPGFQIPSVDTTQILHQIENQSPTHITNEMIPRLEDMHKIIDPDILRIWYTIARRTWALVNRTVLAREHHHSQFYQSGDHSHRHFNAILRRKQDLLESLMAGIDQRLYQLTIGVEEADWLLSKRTKNSSSDSESDGKSTSSDSVLYGDVDCQEEQKLLEAPPTPPSSPTPCQECQCISEDPDEKLNRRKQAVMGQLVNYLNFPPKDSQLSDLTVREIKEVIRNIFRRVIVRDAGLFVRAKEFNPTPGLPSATVLYSQSDWREPNYQCPIKQFVCSEKLSLKELQRLWGLMKFGKDKIGPELIRNAIADIYRGSSDAYGSDEIQSNCANHKKSTKIWILGGFVWRKAMDGPLPRTGSDHLYAFISCAGCMLSTCRNFEEWAGNRRLVVVGGRYPEWSEPQEPLVERLFRCFKIVLCRHNCNAKLSKVEKIVPKSKKLRTVYTETQERHYLHICMSVGDPRTAKIIDALSALPSSFNLYAKRRDTKEVTHKPSHEDSLWCSRVRSGYTTVERKKKRFTPATAFKADANLFEKNLTSPENSFKHRFEDCWDVLVMDAKAGNFDGFVNSIGKVVLEVTGYESIEAAIKGEEERDNLALNMQSSQPAPKSTQQFYTSYGISTPMAVSRLRCCRSLFREPVCMNENSEPESWF
ncbi:hypothetical protein PCANC_28691 [Puccinia coronata f. sp. avenae]|uniref:Uncharacterized protein n=1 Tax=Puccinia coronata f. sp. avenae TaxID=200324 RepID=A0A2N5UVE4_9BASI|nr:hypothetical protein PCANC_28691 [Puccinia coronata f. sp. avenae]PLW41637.1 hypothetical protein PCASD_05402 [Puccinia coronata f. sp. avenae]